MFVQVKNKYVVVNGAKRAEIFDPNPADLEGKVKAKVEHYDYRQGNLGVVHPLVLEFYNSFDAKKAEEPLDAISVGQSRHHDAIEQVRKEKRIPVLMMAHGYGAGEQGYFIVSVFPQI